jgi:hypothetical protein
MPLSTTRSALNVADTDLNNEKEVAAVDGASDVVELSPAERARLLRKLDLHLLPLVSLLYLLSFL